MREIIEDRARKDAEEMLRFLEELKADEGDDWRAKIEARINELKSGIEATRDMGPVETGGIQSFSEEFRVDTARLMLRRPMEEDKDAFLAVKERYSFFKRTFQHDELRDELWSEHLSHETLYCSIVHRATGEYIGYCGIKNLHKDIWEIAIELKEEHCGQGFGYEAVTGFIEKATEALGPHEYCSRVEPENVASQKLMEKLGFQPSGISEFFLHDEEEKREAEEKYAYKLDGRYIELAKRFHTTPEKLISHVLEYRGVFGA